ncbi:MAG TPA: asparaginase [Gaiellales bacterium]|jgi:L-asparaginase II
MPVTVVRGGVPESRHDVHVAVCDGAGRLVAWHGDPQRLTTMRSAAKPLQAGPLVRSGAADAFGFDDETLAVCCASHAGLDVHVAAVERGLAAAGLTPDALRNSTGSPEQRLRHNCSGNHLAFLALSSYRGWEVDDYRAPGHPSQVAALAAVAEAAGVPEQEIPLCTDGCGVVCFALPLATIAGIYARLDRLVPRQAAAMRAHPEMVAGPGDMDTELPRAIDGAVSKGGAEGLGCVALPDGLGIAVRVEDGAWRAVEPAVMDVLAQLLGWDDPPKGLSGFLRPDFRNSPGDVVGFLEADVVLTRA